MDRVLELSKMVTDVGHRGVKTDECASKISLKGGDSPRNKDALPSAWKQKNKKAEQVEGATLKCIKNL